MARPDGDGAWGGILCGVVCGVACGVVQGVLNREPSAEFSGYRAYGASNPCHCASCAAQSAAPSRGAQGPKSASLIGA